MMAIQIEDMLAVAARLHEAIETESKMAQETLSNPDAVERHKECRRETERLMAEYNRLVQEYRNGRRSRAHGETGWE